MNAALTAKCHFSCSIFSSQCNLQLSMPQNASKELAKGNSSQANAAPLL